MRRLAIGFAVIFFVALLFFLLRGPYLSNSIKRVIQPVLEKATGERIIIDKAVINLFPFYLQTKGLKVFDGEGNRLLWVTKMRAYIDLLGLFSKEIKIRRLIVKEPNLTIDKKTLEKIIESTARHTRRDNGKNFIVSLKSTKITDGKFNLIDKEKHRGASGRGLYAEMVIKNKVNLSLSLKEGTLKLADLPEMKGALDAAIKLSDRKIKILGAEVHSSGGSTLEIRGGALISPEGLVEQGTFTGKAKIFVETIANMFSLKESKGGSLSFSGSIDLVPVRATKKRFEKPGVKFNLKTKGWFYLETLMELLKVEENIKGRISLDGEIHGIYPQLLGSAMVELKDAVLDTLPLDDVGGEIRYENKRFNLDDFVAHTYGGDLRGSASLLIPGGEYSVTARAENINSRQFFKFIRWEPPFPEGKIDGDFKLSKTPGQDIELVAEADYLSTSKNINNLLQDRLNSIEADIKMNNRILTINSSVLSTSASVLFLDGSIDLKKEKLSLNVEMESSDAADLTLPYFNGLKAALRFSGKAEGSSVAPKISGTVEVAPGTLNGVAFTEITGDLTYDLGHLSVKLLRAMHKDSVYEVSGSIAFKKASGLFSFKSPHYKVEATIENGDARSLVAAAYKEIPISGLVNGRLAFEGSTKKFKGGGDIILEEGRVFGQPVDRAFIRAVLSHKNISFPSVEIYKNDSRLNASGSIYFDERFNAEISSDNVNLKDIAVFSKYPVDANFSMDIKASGEIAKPDVRFSMNVRESYFREELVGDGVIEGELKNRKLSARGEFLGGIATFDAGAFLSKTLPWNVHMEFKKGRYDFLLAGFLEDVPRDLSASIEGIVNVKGEKDKLSVKSRFSYLSFSLYGDNFTNKDDIVLELAEDKFKVKSFSIAGGNAHVTANGSVKIGKSYNLAVNGRINLTPLKAITKSVESLKGQGSFEVEISGAWESPELRGEMNIRDTVIGLAGLTYKIGPVSGDVFFDKDKVIFDSFDADFANGKVIVSGAGSMEKLSLKRLILSSKIEGIKFRPVEGVNLALDGKLFFETSPGKQNLLGDINIRKAQYEKRLEWKSWLMRLKQVKETSLEQPSFLSKTVLNVHIAGQDDIFINNNIARTPVKIDLNVQGTLAQYGLIGMVEAEGGKIFFRGNEFEIIDANVSFVDPNRVVPIFHIQAETYTKGYRVRLNLDGPADNFTLSLFSDPPLSDMDILALLTSGQINKEASGIESSIGAGEATAFLTGRLQDVIEERFKYITGFERFEVDPQTSSTGAVSPKITVGKRLIGEKLFVTYSTLVGTTEEHIIKLQYNLTKNLSIVGSRDEIGSVGADFKYRFEFK